MFTTFAPQAIHTASMALFPPRRPGQRRFFIFGSVGFWVILGFAWWLLILVRFALLAATVVLILLAQLVVWILDLLTFGHFRFLVAAVTSTSVGNPDEAREKSVQRWSWKTGDHAGPAVGWAKKRWDTR